MSRLVLLVLPLALTGCVLPEFDVCDTQVSELVPASSPDGCLLVEADSDSTRVRCEGETSCSAWQASVVTRPGEGFEVGVTATSFEPGRYRVKPTACAH